MYTYTIDRTWSWPVMSAAACSHKELASCYNCEKKSYIDFGTYNSHSQKSQRLFFCYDYWLCESYVWGLCVMCCHNLNTIFLWGAILSEQQLGYYLKVRKYVWTMSQIILINLPEIEWMNQTKRKTIEGSASIVFWAWILTGKSC